MSTDDMYARGRRPWGSSPSELALIAVDYLRQHPSRANHGRIIDIGCGYGRNSHYLSDQLRKPVLGVDISKAAIDEALSSGPSQSYSVEFERCDFMDVENECFDVLFASNLYHILRLQDRERFRSKITDMMHDDSLLFMNTMSIHDKEEFGKGKPVEGELNSFIDEKYLHFSSKGELLEDFQFLDVIELYEHSYDEPHLDTTHHHVSWILIGCKKRDM